MGELINLLNAQPKLYDAPPQLGPHIRGCLLRRDRAMAGGSS